MMNLLSHKGVLRGRRCSPAVSVLALILGFTGIAQSQEGGKQWGPIPSAIWEEMEGRSWVEAIPCGRDGKQSCECPARDQLALLTIPYYDFAGRERFGQLIVQSNVADAVVAAFKTIHQERGRIALIERIDKYYDTQRCKGLPRTEAARCSDDVSMDHNNTSAFNCRVKTGGTSLSSHGKGVAIDVNPLQNPFVTKTKTYPPGGKACDETNERRELNSKCNPGLILGSSVVTKAFKKQGWSWGGDWPKGQPPRSPDYQHFSQDGQ